MPPQRQAAPVEDVYPVAAVNGDTRHLDERYSRSQGRWCLCRRAERPRAGRWPFGATAASWGARRANRVADRIRGAGGKPRVDVFDWIYLPDLIVDGAKRFMADHTRPCRPESADDGAREFGAMSVPLPWREPRSSAHAPTATQPRFALGLRLRAWVKPLEDLQQPDQVLVAPPLQGVDIVASFHLIDRCDRPADVPRAPRPAPRQLGARCLPRRG